MKTLKKIAHCTMVAAALLASPSYAAPTASDRADPAYQASIESAANAWIAKTAAIAAITGKAAAPSKCTAASGTGKDSGSGKDAICTVTCVFTHEDGTVDGGVQKPPLKGKCSTHNLNDYCQGMCDFFNAHTKFPVKDSAL